MIRSFALGTTVQRRSQGLVTGHIGDTLTPASCGALGRAKVSEKTGSVLESRGVLPSAEGYCKVIKYSGSCWKFADLSDLQRPRPSKNRRKIGSSLKPMSSVFVSAVHRDDQVQRVNCRVTDLNDLYRSRPNKGAGTAGSPLS